MRIKLTFLTLLILLLTVMFTNGLVQAEYDLGGKTVTLISWNENIKAPFEPVWNSIFTIYEGRIEKTEEKFNCKIEFKYLNGNKMVKELMARLMAGDAGNDIWLLKSEWFFELAPEGALYPVEDVLLEDYYQNLPVSSRKKARAYSYKGKTYAFGDWWRSGNLITFLIWNKKIFEEQSLPNLYELYQNKEWTWTKLKEIAKKATIDKDGDGKIDQWGLHFRGLSSTFHSINATNNASETVNVDGREIFALDKSRSLRTLEFIKELGQMGVALNDGGASAFEDEKVAMAIEFLWRIPPAKENREDVGIVPLPMGPATDDYIYHALKGTNWVLPSSSKNPEAMIALKDFLYNFNDFNKLHDIAIKYAGDKPRPNDKVSWQVLQEAFQKWDGKFNYVFQSALNWKFNAALTQVFEGKKDPATAMNELKPVYQNELDQMLNQ